VTVIARLGDLIADRNDIISGLQEHLNPLTNDQRYDWLYLDNPDGHARVWVIEDAEREKIVGTTALLPRSLYINGTKVSGCVIADTWVHPDYRVLGPALKLQRGCLADISSGHFRLGYDFPRQAMIAIYKRLGFTPRDTLVDYVRLLNLDSFLTNRLGNYAPVRLVAKAGNFVIRNVFANAPQGETTIELESTACGDEYTILQEATVGDSTCVARTAQYLNWRYRKHFHQQHEFLVARRAGRLVGYIVFVDDPFRALGVDIVCEDDETLYRELLKCLILELTRRGCQSLQFSALSSDRLANTLRTLHFRPMSETPFVLLPADEAVAELEGCKCSFMIGQEAD